MDVDVAEVVRRLEVARVRVESGLSEDELDEIETRFGISFNPVHRALLATVLPVGRSWVDWRNAPRDDVQRRLDWPIDGLIFDVHRNGFWPRSWGARPAVRIRRSRLPGRI